MFFSLETFLLLTQSQPFRCCQFPSFLIKILENHDILSPDITARESSANINIWQLYLAENVCIHIHIMLVGQDIKMVINIKYIRTTLLPCTAQLSIPFWKKILLLWFTHLILETSLDTTVTLWYCDTVTLWHCDIVTLWHCDIVTIWHCNTVTLWHWHWHILSLWHCDTVTL